MSTSMPLARLSHNNNHLLSDVHSSKTMTDNYTKETDKKKLSHSHIPVVQEFSTPGIVVQQSCVLGHSNSNVM